MQLERAEGSSVYRYEGGYSLIDIHDSQKFLIVPENAQMPEKLPEDVTALQQPVDHTYLAATATMAMFCSMDAMDHIRMSSIKADDWTFDEPKKAMESGDIIYAGIVVSALREVTGSLEVYDDAILVTDNFNLSILDS